MGGRASGRSLTRAGAFALPEANPKKDKPDCNDSGQCCQYLVVQKLSLQKATALFFA
jgi:hypothetical protein